MSGFGEPATLEAGQRVHAFLKDITEYKDKSAGLGLINEAGARESQSSRFTALQIHRISI